MRSFLRALPLVVVLLGGTAVAGGGQDGVAEPAVGSIDSVEVTATAAVASDPLPAPSFTRAYWHLFLAFAFAWVLILVYAVFIDRRVAQSMNEVERLVAQDDEKVQSS